MANEQRQGNEEILIVKNQIGDVKSIAVPADREQLQPAEKALSWVGLSLIVYGVSLPLSLASIAFVSSNPLFAVVIAGGSLIGWHSTETRRTKITSLLCLLLIGTAAITAVRGYQVNRSNIEIPERTEWRSE